MNFDTTRVRFEGAGDDLVHVHLDDQVEEVNTLATFGTPDGPYVGQFVVRWGFGELAVHALYGPGGIWAFAAHHVDDEKLPAYIEVPLATHLTNDPPVDREPPYLSTVLKIGIDADDVEVLYVPDDDSEFGRVLP